ncbi:MAG: methyltransferase domain-containing protein [Pyrinomonadaceae bacterium]
MKESLLPYLACAHCGADLQLNAVTKREGREVLEASLECGACRRCYPVVRGIPRFIDAGAMGVDQAQTAENFGWQWRHFTQQDERYAEQFLNWISPVKREFFVGKAVLEGGCGKGRHTQLAARWGARAVVGVDLSEAVETAFAATRELENAHIIQADIYRLPVKRVFDYAFSVGVLHHLPDPRGGLLALSNQVKPGGHISAWVYGAENNEWIVKLVNPLRHSFTSRINQGALLQLSKLPTALLFAATKLIYGPLNHSKTGTTLARHLFYNDYLRAISDFGWREQHTIVFDHLVAPTAYYITRAEFEEWWLAAKTTETQIHWHNSNSWRGFGRKE